MAAVAFGAEKTSLIGFAQVMDVARELEKHPSGQFTYIDGQGKIVKQISDIEELVTQGINRPLFRSFEELL